MSWENFKPMPFNMGPPLPQSMKIYWPWYKPAPAPPVYTCPYCDAEFKTEEEARSHIEQAHPGQEIKVTYVYPPPVTQPAAPVIVIPPSEVVPTPPEEIQAPPSVPPPAVAEPEVHIQPRLRFYCKDFKELGVAWDIGWHGVYEGKEFDYYPPEVLRTEWYEFNNVPNTGNLTCSVFREYTRPDGLVVLRTIPEYRFTTSLVVGPPQAVPRYEVSFKTKTVRLMG